MSDEARAAGEQRNHYVEERASMTEHLDGKQRPADRPDYRVHGIPRRIDPRNLVREKFKKIKNAGDDNDRGVAQHFKRLIGRGESDPMEMNGQAGGENREVKIDPGETSQTEGDAK